MSPARNQTDPPHRILVTDGEFKHALGIVRSLAARGAEVHVLARSARAPAVHSRAVHAWHRAPAASEPGYSERLLEVATNLAPVTVVLVGNDAMAAGMGLAARWPADVRTALPPPAAFEIACDKARTAALADSLGIAVPREVVAGTPGDALAAWQAFGPLVVVKARRELGRKVLRYARSESELRAGYADVLRLSGEPPLVQEYVTGEGAGFSALYWNGRCVRHFMHRRLREWPPTGGTSAAAESVPKSAALERAGRALLDALQWHGVAMVEFKHDAARSRVVLMEINAKFWGSLDLPLAAGVDFPGDLVALVGGGTLSPQAPYPRLRFTWPLGGDLLHGLARPAALPAVLLDALSPAVAHNLRMSDPLPFLFEAAQWLRSLPGAWRELRETR